MKIIIYGPPPRRIEELRPDLTEYERGMLDRYFEVISFDKQNAHVRRCDYAILWVSWTGHSVTAAVRRYLSMDRIFIVQRRGKDQILEALRWAFTKVRGW